MRTIIDGLRDAPPGHCDYREYLSALLDDAGDIVDANAVFPHAFQFFEDHADADLGMPGPLVHFVERFFPKYVDELCVSVERKPTTHTVWMVNRILNAKIAEEMRERLVNLLRAAIDNAAGDETAREQARHFLEHQRA